MIIYFSGTGNSRLVAKELARHIEQPGALYELSGDRLLYPSKRMLEVADSEAVVWVFPVYSWGVPPVVLKFIDKVKFRGAEKARHYMVCTCGDDAGRTDDRWRQHVGHRGWTPRGAFSVIMPNTYVAMKGFDIDPRDIEAGKLAAMPLRVKAIAEAIRRGFADSDITRGSWAWLKSNVVYWWFMANKMSPLPFRADPALCTACGLCARSCPMLNITMTTPSSLLPTVAPSRRAEYEGRKKPLPRWDARCAMCLRCYHQCPVHAISYGTATEGKGQYTAPGDEV